MANFSSENAGEFGVPGVSIQPSLSGIYDPYSGIDLTNIYSCNYIEVMTQPTGIIGEITYCEDPFAANGPQWFGGTGEPGACQNFGRVNARWMGVLGGWISTHTVGLENWCYSRHQGAADGGSTNPGPMDKFSAYNHPYYGKMGPAFWGYLGVPEDPTEEARINTYTDYVSQTSYTTPNFNYANGISPPGFIANDSTANLSEMRLYWKADDSDFTDDYTNAGETFRFAQFPDDWGAVYMDDGDGGTMKLGNGGEGDYAPHWNGGVANYYYTWFNKTIKKDKLYRILIRHYEHTGTNRYDIGYQSAANYEANENEWVHYYYISQRNAHADSQYTSKLYATFTNPASADGTTTDITGGDGVYYRTDGTGLNETRYYEATEEGSSQDEVKDYIRGINCDTVVNKTIANFNRMRAVCKDGSYVMMAKNLPLETELEQTSTDAVESEVVEEIIMTDSSADTAIVGKTIDEYWTHPSFNTNSLESLKVTKIELKGDFDGAAEELQNVIIGGYNFGTLLTGYADDIYYTVFDGNQNININEITSDGVNYNFYKTPDVNRNGEALFAWAIKVTFTVTSMETIIEATVGDYLFSSGIQACNAVTEFNSNLYYMSDSDKRPSLGLFATTNNNTTNENFDINLSDDIFKRVQKASLLTNGDGRYVKEYDYFTTSLGENSFKPQGNWGYISFDGVALNLTDSNTPGSSYKKRFIQDSLFNSDSHTDFGYAGYYPYIMAIDNLSEGDDWASNKYDNILTLESDWQWARWVKSTQCYTHQKCLEFQADNKWANIYDVTDGTTESFFKKVLEEASENQYRTINQYQPIYNTHTDTTLNPYSSLKVSFWMKTLDDDLYNENYPPYVEATITRGGSPNKGPKAYYMRSSYQGDFGTGGDADDAGDYFYNSDYQDASATHNSITSIPAMWSVFGAMNRFKNNSLDTWEKKQFTFNFFNSHITNIDNIKSLYFLIQASSISSQVGFRGTVYLDNFEVTEAYDFKPDVDVRKKKGASDYGLGNLTEYYDPQIDTEKYKDTTAPLEAQFYFYPRYNYNNFLDKQENPPIIHNDFRDGLFYIYDVDWGDNSPKEFNSKPHQLGENISVYHTYETSGIFEITGTMLRLKQNKQYEPTGVIHNERFVLRININEGIDEDFTYFGSDGFSFIPYKDVSAVIGGYSEQSIYYKSIKRQLGIITSDTSVNIDFKNPSDRLKTEIALDKMDTFYNDDFELLNEFKKQRFLISGSVNPSDLINTGIRTHSGEIGKSIGDIDISNIRYFNEPKPMWEMLGFDNESVGIPNSLNYWKNIIPQDYSIYNREGLVEGEYIDTYSQQNWLSDYYYPVLPKYGADGKFIEGSVAGPAGGNLPFPLEGPITNEYYTDENLLISINTENIEQNVYDDLSGNSNYGFSYSDYRPDFNNQTLEPRKIKTTTPNKTSKRGGAF